MCAVVARELSSRRWWKVTSSVFRFFSGNTICFGVVLRGGCSFWSLNNWFSRWFKIWELKFDWSKNRLSESKCKFLENEELTESCYQLECASCGIESKCAGKPPSWSVVKVAYQTVCGPSRCFWSRWQLQNLEMLTMNPLREYSWS